MDRGEYVLGVKAAIQRRRARIASVHAAQSFVIQAMTDAANTVILGIEDEHTDAILALDGAHYARESHKHFRTSHVNDTK